MEKRSTWRIFRDLGVKVGLSAVLMVAGVHFARSRSYINGIAGLVGSVVGLTRIRPGQVMMDLGRGADQEKNYEAAEAYFAQAIQWNGPVDVYSMLILYFQSK
ncbi:MAG: hypothetical protein HC921_10715 [Synechococcaceae cyanobacterium SM2_3_1]|nr:hypothetical protein [Synechococcaceae cyanobacterium SM2_3_1]